MEDLVEAVNLMSRAQSPDEIETIIVQTARKISGIGAVRCFIEQGQVQCHVDDGEFSTKQHHLIQALTASASVALENLVLKQGVEERIQEKTRALEEAMTLAMQSKETKARFLAMASHDLRQPLQTIAAIRGVLDRLVESEEARAHLAAMGEAIGCMEAMLNNLLDYSKLEAGAVSVAKENFRIETLIRTLHTDFSYLADDKGLTLKMRMGRGVDRDTTVYSDPYLLGEILRNLISNAIKYTEKGTVEITCEKKGDQCHINVSDTGCGIPHGNLNKIFDEYVQLNPHLNQQQRSLGLGLAVVRQIAELLQHPVSVESRLGQGSVFSIDLPIGAAPETVITITSACKSENATVLYIEDDSCLTDAVETLLEMEGFRVFTAHGASEALALLIRQSLVPDVILVDWHLSGGVYGHRLVEQIRALVGENIPAIMLTGQTLDNKLEEAGQVVQYTLRKPVDANALVDHIRWVLQGVEL